MARWTGEVFMRRSVGRGVGRLAAAERSVVAAEDLRLQLVRDLGAARQGVSLLEAALRALEGQLLKLRVERDRAAEEMRLAGMEAGPRRQ